MKRLSSPIRALLVLVSLGVLAGCNLTVSVLGNGTVTSHPVRIDCPGGACTASFDNNATVTLTATPLAGQLFLGWAGDCSGMGTCHLSMGANHSVTARFTPLAPLNDTGITGCSNGNSDGLACDNADLLTDQYPGQDAEHGRDANAATNSSADGHAGFSFTKLDPSGHPLANQSVPYATTPWSCVRDQVTHLTWEVKADDGGLHDKNWTYSWYSPDLGGTPGGGLCGGTLPVSGPYTGCDTYSFAQYVDHHGGLCGFTDWRVPTSRELQSLVDYSVHPAGPTVDTGYFPNMDTGDPYWSSSPYVSLSGYAWVVDYVFGYVYGTEENDDHHVRLVRGGP